MDYEQFKLKVYDSWDLYMHINQFPYIGRCYAWAKREDASQLTEMNSKEREELFDIVIPEWNLAVKELFDHDWPNFAVFGNTAPHLHAHLIPRYNEVREVYGIKFLDPNPTGNYAPYPKKKLTISKLLEIREDICSKL